MQQAAGVRIEVDELDVPVLVLDEPSGVGQALVRRPGAVLRSRRRACVGFVERIPVLGFPPQLEVGDLLKDLRPPWRLRGEREGPLVKEQEKVGVEFPRGRSQRLEQVQRQYVE